MQNLVPDAMRLNKFQHVEIPDNSKMFLRVQGRNLPPAPHDIQEADFFSRRSDRILSAEADILRQYQEDQNAIDKSNDQTQNQPDSVDSVTD